MKLLRRSSGILALMLAVLMAVSVVWIFTQQWPWLGNVYLSYALQAEAWLNGRLDLGQDYSWLELAIYEGKYYVSFPPFPSYVMLPLVALFGRSVPDGLTVLPTLLLGVYYAIKLYRELNGPRTQEAFWVLFLFLGTGYLFIGVNAWVWFIAQSMCFTLSLMALYYAARGRGGISLTCWACSVGCRPMTALFFPLLAYMLVRRLQADTPDVPAARIVLKKLYWAIGPCILAASYMALNYLRFGNVLEFGHNYLPEFTRTPTGQFSLSYLPENLMNLLRLPYREENRLVFQSVNGFAFWLADPLFIVAAAAWGYDLVCRRTALGIRVMVPLLSLAYIFVICCHRTLGGWQFGDRYLLDVLPYLFFGLVLWMPRGDRFARLCLPLMTWGAALNLVGTILLYNNWL